MRYPKHRTTQWLKQEIGNSPESLKSASVIGIPLACIHKALADYPETLAKKARLKKNAMKIKEELEKGGASPKFAVTTKELYDKSFSFPKVRNYDYAVQQMNELEHYEDNLNSNLSNGQHLKKFVEIAKKVRANLNDKYDIGFIDPGVEGEWQ